MGLSWLKHKVTGEMHELETGSKEYLDKAAERDDAGKTVYEDRGLAAHAERDEVPAKGNINHRNYNDPDTFSEAPDDRVAPDEDDLLVGDDRETNHAHPSQASTGESGSGEAEPDDGGVEAKKQVANAKAQAASKAAAQIAAAGK